MTDSLTKLIEAIVALIGALAWPVLVLFIIIYFGGPLKKFLSDMGEFSFKAGPTGLEATAKKQAAVAAALVQAEANRAAAPAGAAAAGQAPGQAPGAQPQPAAPVAAGNIAQAVQAVTPHAINKLDGARVLWVDDRPANNVYEQRALESVGITVVTSPSTADALQRLATERYDAIISDMGRPGDPRAGYTLLDNIRQQGITTPYVIYARSNAPEHQAEARQHGALGSTNSPTELFRMVTTAIQNRR